MALADIETDFTEGVPWRTCAVCHHLAQRDEEWGARLRRLLSNRGIKFRDIAKALSDDPDEPTIQWEALSRHARSGCAAKESLR